MDRKVDPELFKFFASTVKMQHAWPLTTYQPSGSLNWWAPTEVGGCISKLILSDGVWFQFIQEKVGDQVVGKDTILLGEVPSK